MANEKSPPPPPSPSGYHSAGEDANLLRDRDGSDPEFDDLLTNTAIESATHRAKSLKEEGIDTNIQTEWIKTNLARQKE